MTRQLNEATFSVPFWLRDYCYQNRRPLVLSVLLMAAFIYCYSKVFVALVSQWWNNDMYSYAFLIPVISLYMVWVRRNMLIQIIPVPNYTMGFFLLMSGLFMLLIGEAGKVLVVQELSLVVTILSVILFLLGKPFLRILWFPILYLLFMIPIWEFITMRLHFPFQIISATLGVKLLQ